MKPGQFSRIVEGKRYDTSKAACLCGDDWWDGHNFERSGRNTHLYRTPRGKYFFVHLSQWQGEDNSLAPCTVVEAQAFYEECQQHDACEVEYEQAFPGLEVEEA